MNNSTMIPIYLNSDIINNLFTIVVHEFSEVKNIATRDLTAFNITAPLSQLTCGKIPQGDFNVQFLQEKTNQTILENTSKIIVVLLNLINLLEQKNLLTYVNSNTNLKTLKENDFIGFSCKLNNNPTIDNLEKMLDFAEMQLHFNNVDFTSSNYLNIDSLNFLKDKVCKYKECNSIRYITDNINKSNIKFAVPLHMKNMVANIDYFNSNNVMVIGKVVKTLNNPSRNDICCSGSCFDALNINELLNVSTMETNNLLFNNNIRTTTDFIDENDSLDSLIEVVPIAMYI